jgi:hypothetical protein
VRDRLVFRGGYQRISIVTFFSEVQGLLIENGLMRKGYLVGFLDGFLLEMPRIWPIVALTSSMRVALGI